jgi:hypothetical protein
LSLSWQSLSIRSSCKKGNKMDVLLLSLGRAAGFAGVLLCVVVAVARLLGNYWLAGFQLGTLMQAGIAGVVIGCFLLLVAQAHASGERRQRSLAPEG